MCLAPSLAAFLCRDDDVLDVGSVPEAERRSMLGAVIRAASEPVRASAVGEDEEEATGGGDGGAGRPGAKADVEKLQIDPRPAERQREEEERKRALQV